MRMTFGILAGIAVLAVGCATTREQQLPPEQAMQMLLDRYFTPGLEQQDVELFLSGVSESYTSSQHGNKKGLQSEFQRSVSSGYLSGVKVSTEKTVVTAMDDGTFKAYPVRVTSTAGMATFDVRGKQEADGVWRITNLSFVSY